MIVIGKYIHTQTYLCALDVNVYIISGAYAPDNIVKHCSAGLCCTCVYSIYMYYRPASDEWELLRGLRHKPCAVELSECGETVTETERGRRRRGRDGGWSQLILHPAREETQVNAEQCEEHSAEKQFGYDYKDRFCCIYLLHWLLRVDRKISSVNFSLYLIF